MASRRKRPRNLIPRETTVTTQLRLPKPLHRGLRTAARKARTSMHAEILRRLAAGGEEDRIRQIWGHLQRVETDSERRLEWIAMIVKLIWERVNGQQAQTRPAPQNGPAPPQRASQSRDG